MMRPPSRTHQGWLPIDLIGQDHAGRLGLGLGFLLLLVKQLQHLEHLLGGIVVAFGFELLLDDRLARDRRLLFDRHVRLHDIRRLFSRRLWLVRRPVRDRLLRR